MSTIHNRHEDETTDPRRDVPFRVGPRAISPNNGGVKLKLAAVASTPYPALQSSVLGIRYTQRSSQRSWSWSWSAGDPELLQEPTNE